MYSVLYRERSSDNLSLPSFTGIKFKSGGKEERVGRVEGSLRVSVTCMHACTAFESAQ